MKRAETDTKPLQTICIKLFQNELFKYILPNQHYMLETLSVPYYKH